MLMHEFIFSNQSRPHIRRHLVFCLLWLTYIVFTVFFTPKFGPSVFFNHQSGLNELGYPLYSLLVLFKSVLLLFTHMFFCYSILYFFFPNYFFKKKYVRLITGVLLLFIFIIPVGYFLYYIVYPFIDRLFKFHTTEINQNILWTSISAAPIGSIKVTLIAVAITLLKRWWLKQQEREQLEKEKVNGELQLLKAQIHPVFLFSTLNNIIAHAGTTSPKAPEMLIKLSDLLSYMLYECDAPKVKLEREISMIKEYMALEEIRQGARLEMTFQIRGNMNGQLISPLLLLPFIENSFSYSNNELVEQAWVNLDIAIEDNSLSMTLINGMPANIDHTTIDDQSIINVQKRLQLLYPGRHELKINAEQELLMVHLNLKLEEVTQEGQAIVDTTKSALSYV